MAVRAVDAPVSIPPASIPPASDEPRSESAARAIMDEAFACLDRHDLAGATACARRLTDMRHSGAFEIMAEVYLTTGHVDKAIEILEDGVRNAPSVWLLWQSLGNALTQRADFLRAHEAYARALQCPMVDASSVRYNEALAFARQQRYQDALNSLELVDGDHLSYKAASFQLAVHNDMHHFDEVVRQAAPLLERDASGLEAEDRARVHAQLARARLQGYNDVADARHHAEVAIRIFPHEPTARFVQSALARLEAQS